MILFALAFLASDLYLQTLSKLPSTFQLVLLILVAIVVCIKIHKQFNYCLILIGIVSGFCYTTYYAHTILNWSLPNDLEDKPITITGYIASLPNITAYDANFFFELESLQGKPGKTLLRLSWRPTANSQAIMVGDKWKFTTKLKRIHGTQNPGSFNYEAWAVQRGLRANGYVIAKADNQLLSHHWYRYPINYGRQLLHQRLIEHLPKTTTAPWLVALIIGERTGIAAQDWQVLRHTGTNHLMAIAGLHIGILAGFTHFVFAWLWRRSPILLLFLPAQLAGGCAALVVGVFYSLLAGFSIPTQRACVMLSIFLISLLLRHKIHPWHVWATALLMVLLINPLSVLTESFWLSFATIALIIYGMRGRLAPSGWWWKWGRVQWVIAVGLIPITLVLFQQFSIVGFIANSIAIPWLGLFILPFCLLAAIFLIISPTIATLFLYIADKSLAGLWVILNWFSSLSLAVWTQSLPTWWLLAITMLGILILLMPMGTPGRWLGCIWVALGLWYQPAKPQQGDYWLTLLDVGQGLSVVVQTQTHALVFDAGPKFNDHYDMGESVVLPYLINKNIKKLDMLVVSHGDNDHIGGTGALLDALPVRMIMTSVPNKIHAIFSNKTHVCLAGQAWRWDNVSFQFLHPTHAELSLGNNSSCVLRIDNGARVTLITGDIEKLAEKALLARQSSLLATEILIAPHHGSKTSALPTFVDAVHPQLVLYATGYHNRYHFPHPSVVQAYQARHANQLATADTGAIEIKLKKIKNSIFPVLYRLKSFRYFTNLTSMKF